MVEKAKGAILFILIASIVLCLAFAVKLYLKAGENRKLFEKEMVFRLDMEEKTSKLMKEKMDLIAVLKNKDSEIQNKNELISELNQTVAEQNTQIDNLEIELRGMTLLKDKLEYNLKEELSR